WNTDRRCCDHRFGRHHRRGHQSFGWVLHLNNRNTRMSPPKKRPKKLLRLTRIDHVITVETYKSDGTYRVEIVRNDRPKHRETYVTDDREDAINTHETIARRLKLMFGLRSTNRRRA